ncbi:hypothetical protein [Adhaeribacter pallidiroseus]|uniref:Uncharacterized protein n=1 Tax=Adhaeribacter pallidiroseus TaxID=2072847 RepID=A0A369QNY6_9BACT|nr:hypothetical protein [Adhaeribacter pallidiroseus]RDC66090.1 hypothetical protein AHMF7616_04721 [Adhaeribacter pallidiroseus]
MKVVICTLFESHYHLGVAALTNSLYKQGYRGEIYAGYKGTLPVWAISSKENYQLMKTSCRTLYITDSLQIHFIPLETTYHLTNYKPDFMLKICNEVVNDISSIFYFDPDIIVSTSWSYFEEWVGYGVALCEDINSPLAEHHPRRMAWRRIFGNKGILLKFNSNIYVNGGFIGLSNNDLSFLKIWKNIQEIMASEIGGLSRSSLSGIPLLGNASNPNAPFSKTDQDALNAAVEVWNGNVSFIGKEGMAFHPGISIMSHALGLPKPWQWKPFLQILAGLPPRLVDKQYWDSVNKPIQTYSSWMIRLRKLFILLASFIGRFYRRGGI